MITIPETLKLMSNEMLEEIIMEKQDTIESLLGHIRRLERSNQELGEELHRLRADGIGWNKNAG